MADPKDSGPKEKGAEQDGPEEDGHLSSVFYCDQGLTRLKESIEEIAQTVCQVHAVPIKIDEYLCEEAHARAKETLGFHKTKEYSAYKEVAHIGYWLNRLKPIRIDSPMNVFRVLKNARQALNDWLIGKWVELENLAEVEEEGLRHKMEFPINEYVVVTLIINLIEAVQTAHADKLGGALARDFKQAIEDNKLREPWLRKRLESSLRDHNHSARGFATLVETTFRTRCETD